MRNYSATGPAGVLPKGTLAILVAAAASAVLVSARNATAQDKKVDAPAVKSERLEQVTELLWKHKFDELKKIGAAANDVYLLVLKDETSDLFRLYAVEALDVLADQKSDRSQFRTIARRLLTHNDRAIRWRAARLLGDIGSAADAPLLVPLLSEDEGEIAVPEVAEALAKIGTARELEAFNRWLQDLAPDKTALNVEGLAVYRDRLKKRLVAEKRIPSEKKQDVPPVDANELKRVRGLLSRSRLAPPQLAEQGPELNRIYLAILNDQKSNLWELRGALALLQDQKGDRTEFAWTVGNLLSHAQPEIRESAAKLLGNVGRPADAWLLVPLLQDESAGVQYAAGPAIAKLGGSYELKMLDERLKSKHAADSPHLLAELTRCRDQLKARLDARAKSKK